MQSFSLEGDIENTEAVAPAAVFFLFSGTSALLHGSHVSLLHVCPVFLGEGGSSPWVHFSSPVWLSPC